MVGVAMRCYVTALDVSVIVMGVIKNIGGIWRNECGWLEAGVATLAARHSTCSRGERFIAPV